MSNDNIIDLAAARDQRTALAVEDDTHWEMVRDQLIEVMCMSRLHDAQLTSATLRALLDALQPDDFEAAKREIARCLACFR